MLIKHFHPLSLLSIGGISFNRYFNICHLDIYPKVFNLRNNVIFCACFWMVGIVMSLPGLVGWTDNVFDHKYLECIWNRLHNLSYTIFFSSCVVATPVAIISFSFIKVCTIFIIMKGIKGYTWPLKETRRFHGLLFSVCVTSPFRG